MKRFNKIFLILIVLSIFLAAIYSVFADLQSKQPASCGGGWTNCRNAFRDGTNASLATPTATLNRTAYWTSFGFSLGSGDKIEGVIARVDFNASTKNGSINVRVSGNNGVTYGPNHIIDGVIGEQTFFINVTDDFAWKGKNFSSFRVNVTCFKSGSGIDPTCSLDWINVNVTYTVFNFSVSANPSSDTVAQGNNISTMVNLTLLSGEISTVDLFSTGCPPNASCNFSPTSGTLDFSSAFSVNTTSNGTIPLGTYTITLNGVGSSKIRQTNYTLTVV